MSADTIVPNPANPQNLNRYSYVLNNPLRYTDPTGHSPCEEYQGICVSENQMTQIWDNKTGNGNKNKNDKDKDKDDKDDDDAITLTIPRPEVIEIENTAEDLESYYATVGDWWEYGSGAVVGLGMLVVDVPTCVVGGTFTGGAACAGAIALTVAVVPAVSYTAGLLGGQAQANAYGAIEEYFEDVLINNPSEEFTVTISQTTHVEVILPGGVGPSTTTYTVSVEGYSESVIVLDSYGNTAINTLFGIHP